MKLGYIGLGKMGHNMVERLIEKEHDVFAFDINEEARKLAEGIGAHAVSSLGELIGSLDIPRVVWIMVPHTTVDDVLGELAPGLEPKDIVMDGGNSPYEESMRRAKELREKEIRFLDVGVSGGPSGARDGASIMVGGNKEDYNEFEPLFRDLAVEYGYAYFGKHGAGHFVKMVHNGIEYGMMQAIAEGFAVMKESEFNFDLGRIADLYNHGSVVESRLVGWLRDAFEEFGQEMKGVSGSVASSGEGQWTVEAARKLGVPARVIEDALRFRIDSQEKPSYSGKLLSGMRNQFGGHKAT